jgi:hypothetical protein
MYRNTKKLNGNIYRRLSYYASGCSASESARIKINLHAYSRLKVSNCLIVSSKPLFSVSKSANLFLSTSCNSTETFSLYAGSSRIFFCLSIPALVFSSFLLAFWISPSISTRPLTCKKTAAEAETANTTHPWGREFVAESTSKDVTPLPERDLMEGI